LPEDIVYAKFAHLLVPAVPKVGLLFWPPGPSAAVGLILPMP
jgi:hypothetical protein